MLETLERSEQDKALTVRNILSDLRSHQVDGADAAEIREAVELEEQDPELELLPWAGVVLMGLTLVVLLVLWCRGII